MDSNLKAYTIELNSWKIQLEIEQSGDQRQAPDTTTRQAKKNRRYTNLLTGCCHECDQKWASDFGYAAAYDTSNEVVIIKSTDNPQQQDG